jgi:hypothetical protein
MVAKKGWFLSAQNMAQSLVFRMADDALMKHEGETRFYDVEIVSSDQVEDYWRGLLTTTLDNNKYYMVTYNNTTGATKVDVFTLTDTFIIPKD